jgi:hypothetical protein
VCKCNHRVVLVELEEGPVILVRDDVDDFLRVLGSEDGEGLASLAVILVFHGSMCLVGGA